MTILDMLDLVKPLSNLDLTELLRVTKEEMEARGLAGTLIDPYQPLPYKRTR